MDERAFEQLASDAFRRVLDMFEDIDPEDADVEPGGDVIRIDFRDGGHVVINTQRPTRQIWLAGGKSAWHFSYEATRGEWLDDKGRGDELFAILRRLTRDAIAVDLP